MKEMKKIILLMLACTSVGSFVQAQETTETPEKPIKIYTPESGDLGLSVDILSPVMNYVGNMFNNNTNNTFPTSFSSPDFAGTGNVAIIGKYFVYDDFAIRGGISINSNVATTYSNVRDDADFAADPTSVKLVKDQRIVTNNDMFFLLGAEIRRGNNRLQGFYGVQAICGYKDQRTEYAYGNAITRINNAPSQGFATAPDDNVGGNSRLIKSNTSQGKDFLLGIGGFVGVEYFILPKVAIGGEINLTGMFDFGGQKYEKSERYNPSSEEVDENIRLANPGTDSFSLNTHNIGNSFYVSFYF